MVTGASKGIGPAVVRAPAAEGAPALHGGEGRVVATCTHEELLRQSPLYAELAR